VGLHQLALVAMGISIFDNLDFERAVEEARRLNRYEFLFMAAPLRIEKGMGSPLNPLQFSEGSDRGSARGPCRARCPSDGHRQQSLHPVVNHPRHKTERCEGSMIEVRERRLAVRDVFLKWLVTAA